MSRKNYTVLIGYPAGGGHWTEQGQQVELLDVQAFALVQAGRLRLTADIEAEAAAASAETTKAVKVTKVAAEKGAE